MAMGGPGMVRKVKTEEQRRIARLRNIKSTIPGQMKHNEWTGKHVNKRAKRIRKNRSKQLDHLKGEGSPMGMDLRPDRNQWGGVSTSGLRAKVSWPHLTCHAFHHPI